jgi:hypothetical protein
MNPLIGYRYTRSVSMILLLRIVLLLLKYKNIIIQGLCHNVDTTCIEVQHVLIFGLIFHGQNQNEVCTLRHFTKSSYLIDCYSRFFYPFHQYVIAT